MVINVPRKRNEIQKRGRVKTRTGLTKRHEHAADAGDAASHHGREEDPPPAPPVHQVPADEVGRHLDGAADEEALKSGVNSEIARKKFQGQGGVSMVCTMVSILASSPICPGLIPGVHKKIQRN